MVRPRSRHRKATGSKPPAHPALLEFDLARWAGGRVARSGREDALLGRVEALRLSLDGRCIEARVRGNRPLPYRVEIRVVAPVPAARCTCSVGTLAACRHAVAAVEALRFPVPALEEPSHPGRRRRPGRRSGAGRGKIIQHAPAVPGFIIVGDSERTRSRDERIQLARDEELSLRRRRALRERAVVVQRPPDGGPPRLDVVAPDGGEAGVVTLRGTGTVLACCTCSDFAENELQTCTHVERARIWFARLRKRDRPVPPESLLSVWWRPRVWAERAPEPLAEIRIDLPGGALPRGLARYCDAAGWLRAAPPDQQPSAWARRARGAARRAARRAGWFWDLDPAVGAHIRAAAAREALAARLRALDGQEELVREITGHLGLELHRYQEEGARFLARTGRAFLADDMGLGKTAQAIVAALFLRHTAGATRTLVVCPASLKHQWRREIQRVCGETATVVEGTSGRRLRDYANWAGGFLILNYELVLRDLDAIGRAGADLVILDEAQRIKNWGTKTAQAVKQLQSPQAFILTGTPLENRLPELHSLVEFLHPRALGPRWRLLPFHAVTDLRGRVIAYEGLDALRGRLGGLFLRRERRAVLDQLPERTDNTFWTGMGPAQRRAYRRHAAAAAALATRAGPLRPAEIRALLRALTSMRILCNAHAQYAWSRYEAHLAPGKPAGPAEIRALGSPKLEEFARVVEDLLEESDARIVVFSQWERMLRLAHFAVRELLEQRDLRAEVFHGGLNSNTRGAMLEAFHEDPEFRVLFSTDAGGQGLNLQEAASIVVQLEVPWNPAVLEQRIGRVHRMGQRRSVQVLHFVTAGAIEERVRAVVEDKRALFDGLFVEGRNEITLAAPARATFLDHVRRLIVEGPAPGTPPAL